MEQLTLIRITGLLALLGASLYAIGDDLLLGSKASLDDYPRLKPFAKLLSDAEKMVVLPPRRMIWGALLADAGPGDLSFLANRKYRRALRGAAPPR